MYFKLPHDVVCTCAKRDEPPSRRRPFRFLMTKISYCQQTPRNHGRRLRGILFLPCIQWTQMNIRVHSWLIINDLVATLAEPRINLCDLCDLWFL